MITLNIIIDIVAIMPKYEQAELTYQEQVKSDFSEALEKENLEWLDGLIDGLVESHKKTPGTKQAKRKFGIESLEIFNIQNSKGQTAVMIVAKHDKNNLLEKWYCIPDQLTDDISNKEGREGVYEQRISSYIAQDNEGYNALMFAIKSGNSKCFPLLLSPETAVTLNQKDKDGKTALMHAIESKHPKLIENFLAVTEEILENVDQYHPEREIKLEIDVNTSKCIQNIKDENIKSLITKFISELKEHISMPCKIPSLKRKNPEQDCTAPKKRKKYGKITDEIIQMLMKLNTTVGESFKVAPGDLYCLLHNISDAKKLVNNKENCKELKDLEKKTSEMHKLLTKGLHHPQDVVPKLEKKRQEIGQLLLEKLLNEAKISNLIDEKKEEILSDIKNLVIEARIEFPEDLLQNIPTNITFKVTDIIIAKEKNALNSQPNSTINELASCSRNSPLQR